MPVIVAPWTNELPMEHYAFRLNVTRGIGESLVSEHIGYVTDPISSNHTLIAEMLQNANYFNRVNLKIGIEFAKEINGVKYYNINIPEKLFNRRVLNGILQPIIDLGELTIETIDICLDSVFISPSILDEQSEHKFIHVTEHDLKPRVITLEQVRQLVSESSIKSTVINSSIGNAFSLKIKNEDFFDQQKMQEVLPVCLIDTYEDAVRKEIVNRVGKVIWKDDKTRFNCPLISVSLCDESNDIDVAIKSNNDGMTVLKSHFGLRLNDFKELNSITDRLSNAFTTNEVEFVHEGETINLSIDDADVPSNISIDRWKGLGNYSTASFTPVEFLNHKSIQKIYGEELYAKFVKAYITNAISLTYGIDVANKVTVDAITSELALKDVELVFKVPYECQEFINNLKNQFLSYTHSIGNDFMSFQFFPNYVGGFELLSKVLNLGNKLPISSAEVLQKAFDTYSPPKEHVFTWPANRYAMNVAPLINAHSAPIKLTEQKREEIKQQLKEFILQDSKTTVAEGSYQYAIEEAYPPGYGDYDAIGDGKYANDGDYLQLGNWFTGIEDETEDVLNELKESLQDEEIDSASMEQLNRLSKYAGKIALALNEKAQHGPSLFFKEVQQVIDSKVKEMVQETVLPNQITVSKMNALEEKIKKAIEDTTEIDIGSMDAASQNFARLSIAQELEKLGTLSEDFFRELETIDTIKVWKSGACVNYSKDKKPIVKSAGFNQVYTYISPSYLKEYETELQRNAPYTQMILKEMVYQSPEVIANKLAKGLRFNIDDYSKYNKEELQSNLHQALEMLAGHDLNTMFRELISNNIKTVIYDSEAKCITVVPLSSSLITPTYPIYLCDGMYTIEDEHRINEENRSEAIINSFIATDTLPGLNAAQSLQYLSHHFPISYEYANYRFEDRKNKELPSYSIFVDKIADKLGFGISELIKAHENEEVDWNKIENNLLEIKCIPIGNSNVFITSLSEDKFVGYLSKTAFKYKNCAISVKSSAPISILEEMDKIKVALDSINTLQFSKLGLPSETELEEKCIAQLKALVAQEIPGGVINATGLSDFTKELISKSISQTSIETSLNNVATITDSINKVVINIQTFATNEDALKHSYIGTHLICGKHLLSVQPIDANASIASLEKLNLLKTNAHKHQVLSEPEVVNKIDELIDSCIQWHLHNNVSFDDYKLSNEVWNMVTKTTDAQVRSSIQKSIENGEKISFTSFVNKDAIQIKSFVLDELNKIGQLNNTFVQQLCNEESYAISIEKQGACLSLWNDSTATWKQKTYQFPSIFESFNPDYLKTIDYSKLMIPKSEADKMLKMVQHIALSFDEAEKWLNDGQVIQLDRYYSTPETKEKSIAVLKAYFEKQIGCKLKDSFVAAMKDAKEIQLDAQKNHCKVKYANHFNSLHMDLSTFVEQDQIEVQDSATGERMVVKGKLQSVANNKATDIPNCEMFAAVDILKDATIIASRYELPEQAAYNSYVGKHFVIDNYLFEVKPNQTDNQLTLIEQFDAILSNAKELTADDKERQMVINTCLNFIQKNLEGYTKYAKPIDTSRLSIGTKTLVLNSVPQYVPPSLSIGSSATVNADKIVKPVYAKSAQLIDTSTGQSIDLCDTMPKINGRVYPKEVLQKAIDNFVGKSVQPSGEGIASIFTYTNTSSNVSIIHCEWKDNTTAQLNSIKEASVIDNYSFYVNSEKSMTRLETLEAIKSNFNYLQLPAEKVKSIESKLNDLIVNQSVYTPNCKIRNIKYQPYHSKEELDIVIKVYDHKMHDSFKIGTNYVRFDNVSILFPSDYKECNLKTYENAYFALCDMEESEQNLQLDGAISTLSDKIKDELLQCFLERTDKLKIMDLTRCTHFTKSTVLRDALYELIQNNPNQVHFNNAISAWNDLRWIDYDDQWTISYVESYEDELTLKFNNHASMKFALMDGCIQIIDAPELVEQYFKNLEYPAKDVADFKQCNEMHIYPHREEICLIYGNDAVFMPLVEKYIPRSLAKQEEIAPAIATTLIGSALTLSKESAYTIAGTFCTRLALNMVERWVMDKANKQLQEGRIGRWLQGTRPGAWLLQKEKNKVMKTLAYKGAKMAAISLFASAIENAPGPGESARKAIANSMRNANKLNIAIDLAKEAPEVLQFLQQTAKELMASNDVKNLLLLR